MAISYSSDATASASLASAQQSSVQRAEQRQLQAAGQGNTPVDPGQASATTNGGEGPVSSDPSRGSNVDITV